MLKKKSLRTVRDVVAWRLCLGCGACAFVCPDRKINLVDIVQDGIRPVLADANCGGCTTCLDVCPSVENDCSASHSRTGMDPALTRAFGPVLEAWEGFAADQEIRHSGSSGGAITALSLYCLEREGMHGVLHVGGNPDNPIQNSTRMSRSRAELLACTGSRYAPAAACDKLHLIEAAPAPCVFVGQPSEVAAIRKVERVKPGLQSKLGLTISFFCAGSPATQGTMDLLESFGLDWREVDDLRYRGMGWPGMFAVRRKGSEAFEPLTTYKESWGFIQRYRPYSIYLNPDSSGEYADVSCGDPWYREVRNSEEGQSLVLARNERGRRIVRGAIEAGYLQLQPMDPQKVIDSQKSFAIKRGAIWGRLATMSAFGLPVPKLRGFQLFSSWRRLTIKEKLRSTFGTARRIIKRKYYRPEPYLTVAGAERQMLRRGAKTPVRDEEVSATVPS